LALSLRWSLKNLFLISDLDIFSSSIAGFSHNGESRCGQSTGWLKLSSILASKVSSSRNLEPKK
jgi:hypothetical protein